jgi:hypothetical protein
VVVGGGHEAEEAGAEAVRGVEVRAEGVDLLPRRVRVAPPGPEGDPAAAARGPVSGGGGGGEGARRGGVRALVRWCGDWVGRGEVFVWLAGGWGQGKICTAFAPARVEASVVEVVGGDPRQLLSERALGSRGAAGRSSGKESLLWRRAAPLGKLSA